MKQLAIVIPAYKPDFLDKCLSSIASQTCKDFTLYIGDDASPYDLYSIVRKYEKEFDIVYKHFDSNVGGADLVSQWRRCIDLSKEEEWLWLFSDDDEMDSHCVECFYRSIESCPKYDIYHFNVNVIDEKSRYLSECVYPSVLSSKDFFYLKLRGKIQSFVVEYIFSREIYNKSDGFQPFDLAWGSDDATWIKFAKNHGIKTISSAFINWRKSSVNISPNNKTLAIVNRKVVASLKFLSWCNNFFIKESSFLKKISLFEISWFCMNLRKYRQVLTNVEIDNYLLQLSYVLGSKLFYYLAKLYFFLRI